MAEPVPALNPLKWKNLFDFDFELNVPPLSFTINNG